MSGETVDGRKVMTMGSALAAKSIAGAAAGLVGLTVTYPLEYSKVQIQNGRFRSFLRCILTTAKTAGFTTLFTGYAGSVRFIPWEKATKLVVNESLRGYAVLRKVGVNPDGSLKLSTAALCGASAGASQVLITTPMERLRVMSIAHGMDYDKAKQVLSSSRSWYRGFIPTFTRDVLFSALFFPANALMVPWLADVEARNGLPVVPVINKIVAGCIPSALACIAVTPIDVLKTRIQALAPTEFEGGYAGLRHFPRLAAEVGPAGLFKGAMPRAIAVGPLFGVAMLTYDFKDAVLAKAGYVSPI